MYGRIVVEPETLPKTHGTVTKPETVAQFQVWLLKEPETVAEIMVLAAAEPETVANFSAWVIVAHETVLKMYGQCAQSLRLSWNSWSGSS